MTFDPHTTELHNVIQDPVEREAAINYNLLQSALIGDRGEDQKRIAEEVVRWGALLLRKNADYGSSVWKSPVLAPYCSPSTAIRVRMSDKIQRITTLLSKDAEVLSESIDDTLRDLGAYCLLELCRPNRNKPKPTKNYPAVAPVGEKKPCED